MNTLNTKRCFEDFFTGEQFSTRQRKITQADLDTYLHLSGDKNPIHQKPPQMAKHMISRPIIPGMLTAAIGTGLISGLGLSGDTLVAMVEQTLQYKNPVYPGDTVHVLLKVIDKVETSNPERGIVTYRFSVVNQDGATVIEGVQKNLMLKRASESTRSERL